MKNASLETWAHISRSLEQSDKKMLAYIEIARKEQQEFYKATLEIWEGIKSSITKDDQRLHAQEIAFARLQQEFEELKRDRINLDAMIKDLQQRVSKIEKAKNLAN
ncbi:MAG: hypothetical protein ONB46_22785 [candidate division KSB1 bacterium]|nr:hypothetical protein [candidate division KSB1 bacterium]MDZ7368653.1 hypothetical protein [candidate division KSB1 bacterium]MDZ7406468.1 hypothetical protein [candidate division KSB1 bacterium]